MEFDFAGICSLVGTIIGVFLNFSAGILYIEICQGKRDYHTIPEYYIVSNVLANIINLSFSICKNDLMMLISNGIGIGFSLIWSIFYLFYATNKKISKFFLLSFIVLNLSSELVFILTQISTSEEVPGWISVFIGAINSATPGQNIYYTIKNKDPSLIPIWTTVSGGICNFCWFIYGAFGVFNAPDPKIIIPNILGMLLNLVSSCSYFYATISKKQANTNEKETKIIE